MSTWTHFCWFCTHKAIFNLLQACFVFWLWNCWCSSKGTTWCINISLSFSVRLITARNCVLHVTDLFGVEISILVTVWNGNCEEIIMGAGIGCQSVQCSLELSTTWRLGGRDTIVSEHWTWQYVPNNCAHSHPYVWLLFHKVCQRQANGKKLFYILSHNAMKCPIKKKSQIKCIEKLHSNSHTFINFSPNWRFTHFLLLCTV